MDTAVGARRRVRRFVLAAEDLRGELGAGGNGELRKPAAELGLHWAARGVQAATSGRSHDGRAAHQAGLPTSEPASQAISEHWQYALGVRAETRAQCQGQARRQDHQVGEDGCGANHGEYSVRGAGRTPKITIVLPRRRARGRGPGGHRAVRDRGRSRPVAPRPLCLVTRA